MRSIRESMGRAKRSSNRMVAIGILLLGFALRVYQLGHDSFWNDEVGVALAAAQPSLIDMAHFVRGHVMAMPLDYLILWLMARLGFQEFYLRFNSVFWGMLTIATSYALSRRLTNVPTAKLAALLLSVTPLHIHYSQELRFYSSLIFFYILSTYLMLRAIQYPTFRKWGWLVAVMTVGAYFHAFVLLALVNGMIWLLLSARRTDGSVWKFFLGACALLSVAFFPGYLYFRPQQPLNKPLTLYAPVLRAVVTGMGWRELPYQPDLGVGQAWGILCAGLWLIGIIEGFRRNTYLRSLAISGMVQIALIIIAIWWARYFFVYRHVLPLLPIATLFAAVGGTALRGRNVRKYHASRIMITVATGLLTVSSLFALNDYYCWPKSTARHISEEIIDRWSEGDIILVFPSYQGKVYHFYLQYVLDRPDVASSVHSFDPEFAAGTSGKAFLITTSPLDSEVYAVLSSMNFEPITTEHMDVWLGQSLFVRE